jgi:hypothetical protein
MCHVCLFHVTVTDEIAGAIERERTGHVKRLARLGAREIRASDGAEASATTT